MHSMILKYMYCDIEQLNICTTTLNSQFGILIPAGMTLPEKVRTSNEVKSGRKKVSFSRSLPHGSNFMKPSAPSTNFPNFFDISLLTIETKPSNSPLCPLGSRYVSIKPW